MIGIERFKIQTAGEIGQNANTAQPWFPSNGGIAVESGVTYFFDGFLWLSRSAGTTSHTTSLLFAGTATIASIRGIAHVKTGDTAATAAMNSMPFSSASIGVVKAASTSATEQFIAEISGCVRIDAGGRFSPRFQYSAAPGGAPSILENSYFLMTPIGSDITPQGNWG